MATARDYNTRARRLRREQLLKLDESLEAKNEKAVGIVRRPSSSLSK
jgi:hypothetical protein